MTFPRYSIPLSNRSRPSKQSSQQTKQITATLSTMVKNKKKNGNYKDKGFVTNLQESIVKSQIEKLYSMSINSEDNGVMLLWYDPLEEMAMRSLDSSLSCIGVLPSSNNNKNKEDNEEELELLIRGYIGTHVTSSYFRYISNLVNQGSSKKLILVIPNASKSGLKQLTEITNWIDEERTKPNGVLNLNNRDNKMRVQAKVDEGSPLPTIIITTTTPPTNPTPTTTTTPPTSTIIMPPTREEQERATKSWVNRLLVKLQICPFTKSVTKSGQGLGHVNIPVGRISYQSSRAELVDVWCLLADIWEAISEMIHCGPSGKQGISSILLTSPSYDNNFDLWSGPIFTILEACVVASRAETSVGVVCFHPQYVVPDERSSWPGFGHMHSIRKLQGWMNDYFKENSDNEENEEEEPTMVDCTTTAIAGKELTSKRSVAAGGAYQRRMPHATVNVLRADQLKKAEGNRQSHVLYPENIQRLNDIGWTTLENDLRKEIDGV